MDITPVINRAIKRHKHLRGWARREGVTCYRIYDRDIPTAKDKPSQFSIDIYELLPDSINNPQDAAAFMQEQEKRISQNDLHITKEINERQYLLINSYQQDNGDGANNEIDFSPLANALGIEPSHVITKRREHGKGGARYAPYEQQGIKGKNVFPSVTGKVYESGLLFKVNLTRRIDTGLFLDHRNLRSIIRNECKNKRVLNLFCYTGSFSVAAARGSAKSITSVDLSNTYLRWAEDNISLNKSADDIMNNGNRLTGRFAFIKSDCLRFLEAEKRRFAQYDIIILDPPTFSSSGSAPMLDLRRDWPKLIEKCAALTSPNGILYFSANSRRLRVAEEKLPAGCNALNIAPQTISPDFPLHKPHRAWKITQATAAATVAASQASKARSRVEFCLKEQRK